MLDTVLALVFVALTALATTRLCYVVIGLLRRLGIKSNANALGRGDALLLPGSNCGEYESESTTQKRVFNEFPPFSRGPAGAGSH